MASDRLEPPKPNEIEATIFGPGVGECVLLHVGNGEWVVIDSCLRPEDQRPYALHYLAEIGVDPASAVRCVLATHWHDDHVKGLATIVESCPNARFVMSAALQSSEFFRIVLKIDAQGKLVRENSSASEFAEILRVLKSRQKGSFAVGPHVYAHDGLRFYHGGLDAELWALSPSAATVTNAAAGLAAKLLTPADPKRFKKLEPNDLSVAVLLKAGVHSLLLGADLETTHSEHFGWRAVLASALPPKLQSCAYKVAHHGSSGAHHDGIWVSMLQPTPVAVVTPFTKQAVPLPTETDVERIRDRCREAYCTTWPIERKPPRRPGVDGVAAGATRMRRALPSKGGFVRLRIDGTDPAATLNAKRYGEAARL